MELYDFQDIYERNNKHILSLQVMTSNDSEGLVPDWKEKTLKSIRSAVEAANCRSYYVADYHHKTTAVGDYRYTSLFLCIALVE